MTAISASPSTIAFIPWIRRHLQWIGAISLLVMLILAILVWLSDSNVIQTLLQVWLILNVLAITITILTTPVVREARNWYRNDWWLAVISGLVLVMFIMIAIAPEWLAPFDYHEEAGPEELAPGQQAEYYVLVVRAETPYHTFADIGIDLETGNPVPDIEAPSLAVMDERAGRILSLERRRGHGNFQPDRRPLQQNLTPQAALGLVAASDITARRPLVGLVGSERQLQNLMGEFPNLRIVQRINLWEKRTLLGTDRLGRDILSRLIYGTRTTLIIGVAGALAASLIGIPVGLLSGYIGGLLDRVLTPVMDSLYSFPGLILAIALAAVRGPGTDTVVAAIAVIYIPLYFRVIRSQTLTIKEATYVEAARTLGANEITVVGRYVLPNVVASVVVIFTINIADAILTGAALSFLGLGLDPSGVPEWGVDLSNGLSSFPAKWWLVTLPGIAIALLTLCFSLLGESLSEILNPRITRIQG